MENQLPRLGYRGRYLTNMNLNDASESSELFIKLEELADQFVRGYLSHSETTPPDWIHAFPPAVIELHRLTSRWSNILGAYDGIVGTQDRMYLPPKELRDDVFLLVEENQGGFKLTIEKTDGVWSAIHNENGIEKAIEHLPGYLVTFALNEMVMGASLWAVDEEFQGLNRKIMPDLRLLWSDSSYFDGDNVQFYWHSAGAIVASSARGRFDVGTYDLELQQYFEKFGLYDIR